jgi:hypothetical protein
MRLLNLTLVISFYCVSCRDEVKPPPNQLDKLKGTWILTGAVDGTDRSGNFPDLKLTITGTFKEGGIYNYSFTGTRPDPSPWPVSGTWKFGANITNTIIRDPGSYDELEMTYDVRNNTLAVAFAIPDGVGWPGGTSRAKDISGWQFTFVAQ